MIAIPLISRQLRNRPMRSPGNGRSLWQRNAVPESSPLGDPSLKIGRAELQLQVGCCHPIERIFDSKVVLTASICCIRVTVRTGKSQLDVSPVDEEQRGIQGQLVVEPRGAHANLVIQQSIRTVSRRSRESRERRKI